MQINAITGRSYSGENLNNLERVAKQKGYKENEWMTYLQGKGSNMKVKKGEHGVSIFCGYNKVEQKNEKGEVATKSVPGKWARVFNKEQFEIIK